MRIFFCFCFIFGAISSRAQELCSTPTEIETTTRRAFLYSEPNRSITNYYLRIYLHIIRRTDGSGATNTTNNVPNVITTLSEDFNSHQIYFIWNNLVDFIDNDFYYNNPGSIIFNVNNHTDGIDIYLYGENVCMGGKANGIAGSSEYYIGGYISTFPGIYLAGTHVVSHEMGHVLGL